MLLLYSYDANSNIYTRSLEKNLKNVYNYDDKTMKFVAYFIASEEIKCREGF